MTTMTTETIDPAASLPVTEPTVDSPTIDALGADVSEAAEAASPAVSQIHDSMALGVAGERVEVSDSLIVAAAAGEMHAKDSLILLCAAGELEGENVRVVLTPGLAILLGAAAGLVLAIAGGILGLGRSRG